jgi:hypothetical protein
MSQALLIDKENNREKRFESMEEAQEQAEDLRAMGADVDVKDISANGDGDVEAEIIDHSENGHEEPDSEERTAEEGQESDDVQEAQPVPEEPVEPEVVDTGGEMPDPLITVPDWMTTTVDHGDDESVDLNKRGTQVIANSLNYNVDAECEVEAIETDFEYCRYRATVTTPDGDEYTAVGDAHIKEPGNNRDDLERLAETRAKKRAVKWSAGAGLQPFMEDMDE